MQTLKHLAQPIMFSLKNLSTSSKISSSVVVAESGRQNRKCSSISLLLPNRIFARSCEKRATLLLLASRIYARSWEKRATLLLLASQIYARCCEFFPLKRFGDALFAPNYGCYDLIVDIVLFISATRLVLASSLYLQTLTRANVI